MKKREKRRRVNDNSEAGSEEIEDEDMSDDDHSY